MTKKNLLLLSVALTLALTQTVTAAELKSPEQVKNSLRILAYVQDDMQRKLPNKNYNRLPHENQEFQEAAEAMRDSVASESKEFQAKVETALEKALAAANHVADVSASNNDDEITAAVAAVAAALQPLNELFPEELRPVPGQLGRGPGRRSGPPPDLR